MIFVIDLIGLNGFHGVIYQRPIAGFQKFEGGYYVRNCGKTHIGTPTPKKRLLPWTFELTFKQQAQPPIPEAAPCAVAGPYPLLCDQSDLEAGFHFGTGIVSDPECRKGIIRILIGIMSQGVLL